VHGDDDQRDFWKLACQVFDQFQSRFVLERNVNEGDIRPRFHYPGDRLGRIFCLAANDKVVLRVDEISEPFPNKGMIIDHKNTTRPCQRFRRCGIHGITLRIIPTENALLGKS